MIAWKHFPARLARLRSSAVEKLRPTDQGSIWLWLLLDRVNRVFYTELPRSWRPLRWTLEVNRPTVTGRMQSEAPTFTDDTEHTPRRSLSPDEEPSSPEEPQQHSGMSGPANNNNNTIRAPTTASVSYSIDAILGLRSSAKCCSGGGSSSKAGTDVFLASPPRSMCPASADIINEQKTPPSHLRREDVDAESGLGEIHSRLSSSEKTTLSFKYCRTA